MQHVYLNVNGQFIHGGTFSLATTLALMKFDLKQFRLRPHSDKEQMA